MSTAPERTSKESLGTFQLRELIGISELDSRIQEQIGENVSIKSFQIVLWRDAPDATGCNWNAHIERVQGNELSDLSWCDVVPQMRLRFNLT